MEFTDSFIVMRIVFLSQRFLLPMDTGGKIRSGKILEQIAQKHHVTLISNVEFPRDEAYLNQIKNICTTFIGVPWKEVQKYSVKFWLRLFFQMFSIYPVNALNDFSRSLRQAVERESNSGVYDIAICDFVQSSLLFKGITGIPTILFQHNVESVIAERHLKRAENFFAKLFWWLQWKKMFLLEKKACRSFDTVISVSENDSETFRILYGLSNVEAIPTGVDTVYYYPLRDSATEKLNLVFCGSMDWLPNEDAMVYFIKQIMPRISKKIGGATLTIVGRNPSSTLQTLAEKQSNIILTGWVEDIRPYIWQAALVVVPIRIGGGTRMKIYEAMAMGKTVISTSVGAEGLPIKNGKNIIIEDDPTIFADKIVYLLRHQREWEMIGFAASAFVRKHFSWQKIADKFTNICEAKT